MDIRQAVLASVDMHYYRSQLKALIVATVAMMLLLTLPFLSVLGWRALWHALFVLLCFAPFTIYYGIRMRELLAHTEQYVLYEAFLDDQRPGFMRGTMYLTAHFTDAEGYKQQKQTCAVFPMSALSKHYFGNYVRQTVPVAYDRTLDRLVVVAVDFK